MPQEICNQWESNGRRGWRRREGEKCQFSGVVWNALCGIKKGYRTVWERWKLELEAEVAGKKVENEKEIVGYFGKRWVEDKLESNRLIWAFSWLICRVENLEEIGIDKA